MQKIHKENEPESLTLWKRANPDKTYTDLSERERIDIRSCCIKEQLYLCAYCCQSISGDNCDAINEHVEARRLAPNRSLDFNNIVASCTQSRQCDKAHGSQPLPLTPFMNECETELQFKISGRVEGLTARAKEAIRVLNLGDAEHNNRSLIEKRKRLTDALLSDDDGNQISILDEELISLFIEDIQIPRDGRLSSFAPVAVNILRGWLGK